MSVVVTVGLNGDLEYTHCKHIQDQNSELQQRHHYYICLSKAWTNIVGVFLL